MLQQKSMVRCAADEFTAGNYSLALHLYQRLSDLLGEKNFRANVSLCEKRLRSQGRRNCADLPLSAIKVACVMDEFTFHCYEPECDLLPLTPDNAIDELTAFKPDLLFIESAWRGKDELWNRKIGSLSRELRSALQWCKERGVPTVFWNKEDPIHFETFLTTAQQFDFVFTTDIDCIARYKAALGHERVYLLPFACQPKTHNPIELYLRKDAFCFAGAYYVRYPERTRDLENYVAELPKHKPLEIFDRNFGKDDVNYMFPPAYHPYIVGTLPFNEIDKAYKGYRYSINLNSIKQSQTMFARRVYELLGSNTITVSNFSRGVRLLFGDLVIASDNGKEIVERLQRLDEETSQKLRLAGLRKVMLEHNYEHRLAYVARKTLQWRGEEFLPVMVVVAFPRSEDECRRVIESYQRQRHVRKRLLLVIQHDKSMASWAAPDDDSITVLRSAEVATSYISTHNCHDDWVALMAADDYYGPNYLLDLAIATRYSPSPVVGKATRYQWNDSGIALLDAGRTYQLGLYLPVRASAIRADALLAAPALLSMLDGQVPGAWQEPGLAIDAFNYCENGHRTADLTAVCARVDDLQIDSGIPIDELLNIAEGIPAAAFDESGLPKWNAAKLAQVFGQVGKSQVHIAVGQEGLRIESKLADGKHEYLYAVQELPVAALPTPKELNIHLEATPGLDVQYVFVFLDDRKQKISHVIHSANRNHSAAIPAGTAFVRMGWRVAGAGATTIKHLMWGHRKLEPTRLLGGSDTLLLTNHYPSYDDLYRNGFVHSRVKSYLDRGVKVDVFRLRMNEVVSYHEFQNVDVVTGGQEALRRLLSSGRYKRVLVHFLSPEMWEVLERFPSLQRIVWVHGAEIQPWHRREYNYRNEQERAKAMRESDQRMAFWRGILKPLAPNLKLVFVSRHFADEVFEDLGFRLPEEAYVIIHNPIDTKLFSYQPKPADQRKRVLSIRPYASRKYANDLSVEAILKLSERPFFKDMEFRMIGDGKLFDETLEPLRKFTNVTIEQRFLTQLEISALHKDYGIFLVPTRMDSQGVSRDEAMSSGLVPVTNAVAAIPEFVDETCGILAPAEDAEALAEGIARLYESPELFEKMSKAAAQRVINQSALDRVVKQEIQVIFADTRRKKDDRPVSFISFDVEALPGRAAEEHVERLIWGRFDGDEFGIRRISGILQQYGIKGNFLIDFAACLLYGDKAVADVVDFLLSEGHEVHVHLHSEWVIRKWGLKHVNWAKCKGNVGMEMLDDALNLAMLKFAAFKYRALVGKAPMVFRAGGYRFNAATVEAAGRLGFKACTNFNSTRHEKSWACEDPRIVNNEPFRWSNGLIELPVDFSPEPLSHDWAIYLGVFDRVLSRKHQKTFNLTLHSWSLLTRGDGNHFTCFSKEHEQRLHEICRHLKEHTSPMGYDEYLVQVTDISTKTDCRCTVVPDSIVEPTSQCSICGATYGIQLENDVCPSCGARARHRQILNVLDDIGNPFDGRTVLACHANPVEKQAFLGRASRVVNFDVRPLGYADLQMDIQSMDKIADASFDTFVAIHVLNHVADYAKALREIHRILKPGGVALVTVPCRENSPTEACTDVTEHYGRDALDKFGVGSYRRYGLGDAHSLFSRMFTVKHYRGFDEMTSSFEHVFLLSKTPNAAAPSDVIE